MRQQLRHLLLSGLSTFWRKKYAPRVIYYHSIHPTCDLSQTPDSFRGNLTWLQENGFQFFTFQDLLRQIRASGVPTKAVAITFDDGYRDNYTHALPILTEMRIPATFFVVSSMIKERPEPTTSGHRLYNHRVMMTQAEVRELHRQGMEIGSHTRTHVHVKRLAQQSKDRAWEELYWSRIELQDIVGTPIASFAYPNGQKGVFDNTTKSLLRETGYEYAATTIWGYINEVTCDQLETPRMEIRADDTVGTFRAKMGGKYDFLHQLHMNRDGSRYW